MKKDVIYIDLEDDITAIIGKVKDSAEKIVALVPPKRTGVLQSAVNLKLLQKAALSKNKRVVLITNNKSLIALAAGIKVPVARNLQSKPEVPELENPETSDNEIIDGAELPVGDFADKSGAYVKKDDKSQADSISDKVDFANKDKKDNPSDSSKKKGKIKIPNFNIFRKKLFIFGGVGVLLIGFLIWAIFIAPSATITINAKTTPVNINRTLALQSDLEKSKTSELTLKAYAKQVKKTSSVEFNTTGTKEVGEKASGSITLSNSDDSDPINISSGTKFTSADGKEFTNTSDITIPGAEVSGGVIQPGQVSATITASEIGSEYNIEAQNYSVSGYSGVGASGEAMSGGSKEEVRVVSQDDIDKASKGLTEQDSEAAKEELKNQFSADYIIIQESFLTEAGSVNASPAVNEQAQKGKVSLETTYTLVGLLREDVKQVIADVLKDSLDSKPNQSVFNDGSNDIAFQLFKKTGNSSYTANLTTTGYIGTTIEVEQLAEDLKGKRYGEIEQIVNQISGVDSFDVSFSPFWVTVVPNDTNKITIRFSVSNEAE